MDNKNLKINIRSFLSLHLSTFIVLLIGFLVLYYLKFEKHFVRTFLFFWFLNLLPSFYLHFKYWQKNKGEEYEIRDAELIKRKEGKVTTYKNEDIEKIIIYLSPSLYKNSNFRLLTIESYHYAIVQLKTGEELILTCLLAPRIDKSLKQLKGVVFEKRKQLFCTLKWRW